MNTPKIILSLLLLIFIGQLVFYYPVLPESVAIHFDAQGRADNWASKQSFLFFQFLLLGFIAFQAFLLPRLLKKLPVSLLNIPNKEYWTTPERREQTFSILENQFEWLAVGIAALFLGITQLTLKANLSNQNLPQTSWLFVGGFVLFVIFWTINLCGKFKITQ